MKASPPAVCLSLGGTSKNSQSASSEKPSTGPQNGPALLKMQRQIHCVQKSVPQVEAEVSLTGNIQHGDIVTDVMSDNHAVTQIIKKCFDGFGLIESLTRFFTRDTVHGHRRAVVSNLHHRFE